MIGEKATRAYKRYHSDSWISKSQLLSDWVRRNKQYFLATVVVVAFFCICLGLYLLTTSSSSTPIPADTGFIIAGGYRGEVHNSAEIFNPKTGHSCLAGDLTTDRQDAPMCNNIICGGYGSPDPHRSCERFDGTRSFKRLGVYLKRERDDHLCWGLQSGEVILFGGHDSKRTTERVSADGSTSQLGFDLSHDSRVFWRKFTETFIPSYSCGIDLGDKFVITGGDGEGTTVVQYSQTGFVKNLANLNRGRRSHACSKFLDNNGNIALLVTGGYRSSGNYLASTEIYSGSRDVWTYAAPLPSERAGISAATLDNSILIFGGRRASSVYTTEILEYDSTSDTWKNVGELREQRAYYGLSPVLDVSEVCP